MNAYSLRLLRGLDEQMHFRFLEFLPLFLNFQAGRLSWVSKVLRGGESLYPLSQDLPFPPILTDALRDGNT